MADLNKALGAGLRHGYVKDSGGIVYDINAIVNVEADNEQEDTEVRGDDSIKAVFSSARKETLTITANGVTFDVIQAFTGNTVNSSASTIDIPLGTQSELNPPLVEVGALTNGKNEEGTNVVIRKVFHKVQINSVVVNQESESEFSLEMTGQAVQTATDIIGGALTPARTSTLSVYVGTAE